MFQFAYVGIAGGGPVFALSTRTVNHNTAAPTTATAGYQLTNTGKVQRNGTGSGGSYVDVENWVNPTSLAGAGYECKVTIALGTLSSGTSGSWLALSSTRTWEVSASSTTKSCTFTVEIRDAASLVVLASAVITLNAQST